MPNIVVGYDGSDHARRALARAAELAAGGSVTVVSVIHVPIPTGRGPAPLDPAEVEQREKNLDEAGSLLAERGVEARLIEGHGDPAEAIVEEARQSGADLVAVGTKGKSLVERALLGSVSTKVVHEASCDVLVVR